MILSLLPLLVPVLRSYAILSPLSSLLFSFYLFLGILLNATFNLLSFPNKFYFHHYIRPTTIDDVDYIVLHFSFVGHFHISIIFIFLSKMPTLWSQFLQKNPFFFLIKKGEIVISYTSQIQNEPHNTNYLRWTFFFFQKYKLRHVTLDC